MRKKDVFRSTVARKREAELEGIFRELTDVNGQMLVRDLVFTATKETALDNRLPNIVVYWHDAAFVPGLRVAGTNTVAHKDRPTRVRWFLLDKQQTEAQYR